MRLVRRAVPEITAPAVRKAVFAESAAHKFFGLATKQSGPLREIHRERLNLLHAHKGGGIIAKNGW